MTIKIGDEVAIHYTMKLESGETIESTHGKEPARFTLDSKKLLPGMREALVGLRKGDKKKITLPPDKCFGDVREDLFREVPKSLVQKTLENPSPGAVIQVAVEDKCQTLARIDDVTDDTILLDFNHPLAGQKIIFDFEVIDVRDLAKYVS